jgi:hypothetical protein
MQSHSSPHAYVSIRSGGVRSYNVPRGRGSVVFVDLSSGAEAERIRELPPTVLREPRAKLLFRLAEPGGEAALEAILERWDLPMEAALLTHPLGEAPAVQALGGGTASDVDVAAARAIELEALLEWGKAIWRPQRYHFRLPSGEHAPEFAKLSDAIRAPRDARVLASWLLEWAYPYTGFVVDTGTLTPVIEAVQRMMVEGGREPGAVAVLDQYPRNSVDVDTAVEVAAGDHGRVVALISVNSSGAVRDRLLRAIERQRESLVEPRVVVMLDKQPARDRPGISTWSPLPGEEALLRGGVLGRDECEYCLSAKRARIIPINPYTFDGMLPGQVVPIMPSVTDARANWRLWEACSQRNAIAVESRSVAPVPALRASGLMPVRLKIDELIAEPEFRTLAAERLGEIIREAGEDYRNDSDLVLVPAHELAGEGFSDLWAEVGQRVAPDCEPLGFSIEENDFDERVTARLAEARMVTIFALGAVSGWSLQKALVGVQHAHPEHDLEIQGLVLHARPAGGREWETLENSFGHALFAGFYSILPDRSPLAEEKALLQNLDRSRLSDAARALFEQRLRLCNGEGEPGGQPAELFYGAAADAELTRNSIFGQRLDARAVYAAVAAAMARARERAEAPAPEFRVFDLAGIARSYYDPLILAAMLRWLYAHESWWGWRSIEAERLIAALLERAPAEDQEILVPELLLAYAQGKVHMAALETILARAEQLQRGAEPRLAAAIELTRALADRAADFALDFSDEDGAAEPAGAANFSPPGGP